MKVTKDAVSSARRLFRLCFEDGMLNQQKLSAAVKAVAERKPRGYKGMLITLRKLTRIELSRYQVVVESAADLDTASKSRIETNLTAKHGAGLTFEYVTNPALLGGIRIRKGDDVWDGSVKSRLDRLVSAF